MTKQDDVEALLKDAIDAEFKRQVAEQIKDIFASVPEADSGGAKTVIGGVNIHFGGTIWPLLSCGVTIILATLRRPD